MFETTDGTASGTATGTATDASFEEELAGLARGLRAWAGQDLSLLPVVAVPRRVEILLRARNEIDGELLRELQAADRSGEAARLGGGSTVGWLAEAGRLDHRHASSLVRTARGLADRLPATAKALSTGDITFEHARVSTGRSHQPGSRSRRPTTPGGWPKPRTTCSPSRSCPTPKPPTAPPSPGPTRWTRRPKP